LKKKSKMFIASNHFHKIKRDSISSSARPLKVLNSIYNARFNHLRKYFQMLSI